MLYANQLNSLLSQVSKVRILRFLVKTWAELNGREIAAATGLSHVKVHTALKELGQYGVVTMRGQGRSILYRLNADNVLVKRLLVPLFENEERLGNLLSDILARYLKASAPKSVILFGSFATDRARPDSDIDVLVISSRQNTVKSLEMALAKAETSITIGFGNHLAPIVMDEAEFREKFRKGNKFIRSVVKNGKVLFGMSINELITL